MAKKRVHTIHYKYLPPFRDTTNNVLTFMGIRYHIPNTTMFNRFYKDMVTLVKENNYQGMLDKVIAMDGYRMNVRMLKSQRQTRRVDSVTGAPAE
jgi:hypothetical protein